MTSSGKITVELMQSMLREVEQDDTIVVLPCLEVDEMNEVQHYCSSLSRVRIKYIHSGEQSHNRTMTLSLIVKLFPETILFPVTTMFVREMQMYDEILPRMSALLTKTLLGRHTDFTPRGYFTRKSPNYLLAIEDLAPKGFKAPERKHGLDMKQCLLAVRAIARFHAASVMIRNENESLFNVFDDYSFREEGVREHVKEMLHEMIPIMSQVVESWPEFGHSWANRMRNRSQTMFEDLLTLWKRDDCAFNVLNHGDFGCHNMLYCHSEYNGEAEAFMLVDFQFCCYNSPVLDLHQLIFSNANSDVSIAHIDTLLREYHAELTATLESLGAPQEHTISLTELLQEFDRKLLYAFHYVVCWLPLFSTKSDSNLSGNEMSNLGSSDIEKFQFHLSDSFIKIFKRMLPIFSEKNVI